MRPLLKQCYYPAPLLAFRPKIPMFHHPNVDPKEIQKFEAIASHWWDANGPMKTLHQINPLRLQFIQKTLSVSGKTILDVGCGGGILSESLALLGATVTGIDTAERLIEVAKLHLLESQAAVTYHTCCVEDFAKQHPSQFDVITCLEMLEHVPDPLSIFQALATLVKPGGQLFISTLNRNLKSFFQAIVVAEHVLKLLPKGTHHYERFIQPSELISWGRQFGFECQNSTGITYQPIARQYRLTSSVEVNYLLHFLKNTDETI